MGDKDKTRTFVIVNPDSAGGATMKRWPRVSEKLERAIGKFDYDFTNAEGVATLLANSAVKNGFDKIIVVGGDGTLHEVLQGLFENGVAINPEITLGMLPSGAGADLVRTFGVSNDIDESIVRARGTKIKKIDLGLARFRDHNGKDNSRYFINVADVGLGGEVAERVNNSPKVLGGFGAFLFSSVISFAVYKPKLVKITIDNETFEQNVTSIFVANGRFFGGGMLIAPNAEIDDGLFDVIVIGELSKWDLVAFTPKLYSGKLLSIPGVKHFKTSNIMVDSHEDVLLNLDGEQPGMTPVSFSVISKAVNFKV